MKQFVFFLCLIISFNAHAEFSLAQKMAVAIATAAGIIVYAPVAGILIGRESHRLHQKEDKERQARVEYEAIVVQNIRPLEQDRLVAEKTGQLHAAETNKNISYCKEQSFSQFQDIVRTVCHATISEAMLQNVFGFTLIVNPEDRVIRKVQRMTDNSQCIAWRTDCEIICIDNSCRRECHNTCTAYREYSKEFLTTEYIRGLALAGSRFYREAKNCVNYRPSLSFTPYANATVRVISDSDLYKSEETNNQTYLQHDWNFEGETRFSEITVNKAWNQTEGTAALVVFLNSACQSLAAYASTRVSKVYPGEIKSYTLKIQEFRGELEQLQLEQARMLKENSVKKANQSAEALVWVQGNHSLTEIQRAQYNRAVRIHVPILFGTATVFGVTCFVVLLISHL